jgi:hypothetical protein
MKINASLLLCAGCIGVAWPSAADQPDLIIWGPSVHPHFEVRTFGSNDCETLDGCATPGTRRLLRFATETRNIGTADLVLGNPTNNPLFVFDPCHGHYHFEGFVAFRLLDTNNVIAATGKKIGFELEDSERWDTTNASPNDIFWAGYQGIAYGWYDLYDYLLPCQYVDITDVAPGPYTLELEVNPDRKLAELDYSNNITRVPVTIPVNLSSCDGPPTNDLFANALVLTNGPVTVQVDTDCATRETGEPMIRHNPGGRSVWFRWTAPTSGRLTIDTDGSDFDTLMGLYTGADVNSLTEIAADDDSGVGRASRIATNVTAGVVYSIAVDGYYLPGGGTYSGNAVLNLNWRPDLRLLSPVAMSGAFQFTLLGMPGDRCVVESSPDLVNWNTWSHITNISGSILLTPPLDGVQRFYRAHTE